MFIVLSLAFLYLLGLGSIFNSFSRKNLAENLSLTLGLGILFNYLLFLLAQKISIGLALGGFFAVIGLVRFGRDLRKQPKFSFSIQFVFILLLIGLYYLKILSEPLHDWDARSIWFFHAKIIWLEGAINNVANWHHLSLQWTHVDYPELIPSLAAQLGYLKGYWNEFFPKGSLFLMLLPPIFWVFSFFSNTISFLFLVFIMFFSMNFWLWNGYMDGYIALYAATSALLFGRYYEKKNLVDLYSGICALGIIANIKNEGLLFCACMFVILIVKRFSIHRKIIQIGVVSSLPTVIWTIYKSMWNLHNDLKIDSADVFKRIFTRLTDGSSPFIIFETLFIDLSPAWKAYLLVLGVAMILLRMKKKISVASRLAICTSVLYFFGLFSIYLLTPFNVVEHMSSSADRTMLPVTLCALTGLFFLVRQIEE